MDAKFAEVEALYNNYVSQKTSLSAAARQTRENAILNKEKEAQEYQESLFGQEGTLMKKRIEVISPIQRPTPSRRAPTWCSTRRTTPRYSTPILP